VLDGSHTRFWEDLWLGREPFNIKYPSLYNLVKKKNLSVAQVLSTTPLNISFRRALVGVNWDNWFSLVGSVLEVTLKTPFVGQLVRNSQLRICTIIWF
jgi:hypothetical protein